MFSDQALFEQKVQMVRVSGTTPAQTLRVPSTTPGLTFHFPLTPRNGVCRVAFSISPARIPSHYPQLHENDPRLLGLHFAQIEYTAKR